MPAFVAKYADVPRRWPAEEWATKFPAPGDEVQAALFWQKFKESAQRRNQIIHQGNIVGKTEAEESYKAAADLIAHLKK